MYNNRRNKTELENKIYRDIQSEIQKYYDKEGIFYKQDAVADPEDTIIEFFSYIYKMIPVTKRKVEYSIELKNKIDSGELSNKHIDILKKYEQAFEEGQNMNIFLSSRTTGLNKPDFLLYTWHLYHLHMSGKIVPSKEQMKNNRSDTLLLCIINSDNVYFLDVIPHPRKAVEFFRLQHLEIISNNNWMNQIGFDEIPDMIPGTLKPNIISENDLFSLYSKCAMNVSFEFNGKGYCACSPMTANRKPAAAVEEMIRINKNIRKLNRPNAIYKGFKFASTENGILLGLVQFEDTKGERICYNIL